MRRGEVWWVDETDSKSICRCRWTMLASQTSRIRRGEVDAVALKFGMVVSREDTSNIST